MIMNRRNALLSLGSLPLIFGGIAMLHSRRRTITYPRAPFDPNVRDSYFGTVVPDPYRPLEQLDAPATRAWIEAENHLTKDWLDGIGGRPGIESYLEKIWNYPRTSVPSTEGGKYFFTHNSGLDKQPRLYVAETVHGPRRLLVDPLAIEPGGTVSINRFEPSPDGRYVAYALSDGGSDFLSWHIVSVDTLETLPETIVHTKFTPVSWARDNSGFYYSRHPARPDGSTDDQVPVSVHFHRLRTPQSDDRLILALGHQKRDPYPTVSDDGRYLLISVFDGYERNAFYYIDLEDRERRLVKLCDDWDGLYYFVGNSGSMFYIRTTVGAPRGRIIAIDIAHPERSAWRTHIAENEYALDAANHIGSEIITIRLADASSRVDVYDAASGAHRYAVTLPGLGSAKGFGGRAGNPETFFEFASFTEPPCVYHYDSRTNALALWQSSKPAGRLPICEVTRIEAKSADSTPIRAFVIAPHGAKRNGKNPVLLYGYGGFANAITPYFSPRFISWVAMGGTVVVANLRGGNEYGEAWHLAGTRFNKQHVFDDFVAIARQLILDRYTSAEHLAIMGGSNGGLLVGAVINQHPELFAAAVAQVGVMDMLRYHTACANAEQWGSEYGTSAQSKADFDNLLGYSPCHNIYPAHKYPAIFALTADHDNRVAPWHTFKWVARLQDAIRDKGSSAEPVLLRVDTRAGHGAGKSVTQSIAETADILLFLKGIVPGLSIPA